jgi:hypothetical protein
LSKGNPAIQEQSATEQKHSNTPEGKENLLSSAAAFAQFQ